MSLQEIKSIAIVNWIFQVSVFFKIIFKNIISFKYGLILLGYSSIDSVLFLSPLLSNYLSYWFVLIFFLDLKTVPNISYYSVFGCFIFFFQTKKISYIFNCSVIYFIFQSKKVLTSFILHILFCHLFPSLDLSSLYI